ncbi:MAG TPA: hypothetical protein VFW14_05650 [Gaiellales bacterium]|nr:hypothetical protein [Gaiellales bacterium]
MRPAPDYLEPVHGWRLWSVVDAGGRSRLQSLVCPSIWWPGHELVATCEASPRDSLRPWRRRMPGHAAPESRCTCGVHAMERVHHLGTYVPPAASRLVVQRAVGRVALWGEVIEGSRGWRAARAYPAEIWIPHADLRRQPVSELEDIALELADYGVPVHICDGMTAREVIAALAAGSPRMAA